MKLIDWNALDGAGRARALARPQPLRDEALVARVREIIALVRRDGDAALRTLTRQLDGCALEGFEVGEAEFAAAQARVPAAVREAMAAAIRRVEVFHQAQRPDRLRVQTAPGVVCEYLLRPVRRVGLYAPGGSAPLPSTVWMLAVPARIAGCPEVVLATPPRRDGCVDPLILTAARLCGVQRVFRLGGAQAIAALAYGTESVPRCDKLFGPGNAWVTQAKVEVAGDPAGAAIDLPAGPSEVMVIADDSADAAIVAADLLAQAEHGADSQVILASPDAALLHAVERCTREQVAQLPREAIAAAALAHARLVQVRDLAQAVEVANAYAPEHLIVQTREPRRLLPGIHHAGSIFLGPWSPETVGDYCAGPNHVLPTLGWARAFGGVGVASFLRRISVQELSADGLRGIGPEAALLARAEQLEAHARAVDLRLARLAGPARSGAAA